MWYFVLVFGTFLYFLLGTFVVGLIWGDYPANYLWKGFLAVFWLPVATIWAIVNLFQLVFHLGKKLGRKLG